MFVNQQKLIQWLEDHRGLVIVLFCLPASFLFDKFLQLKHWFEIKLQFSSNHNQQVCAIQKKIREWNNLDLKIRKPLCTSRPNWLSLSTTFFQKKTCHQIEIPLHKILHLDEKNLKVKVEPMVTVREITKFLIPRGFILAVTLEIGDATCGGLGMAVGMTTYSHNIGLYQEAVESYDVVLADGSLVNASKDNEHKELFYCLPWSHGTLGFLVAIELKIIPVKPYVHLQYIPLHGQKKYCDKLRVLSGAKDKDALTPDFVEGTIFDKDNAVVMIGNFANVKTKEQKNKVNHLAR